MQLVHIYLNFAGNTEEAFKFYEKVFGTRILMKQTYGETPFMKGVPESAKNKIMHIQLPITEAVHLMGSDAVEGIRPAVQGVPGRTTMSPTFTFRSSRTTRPRPIACSRRSAATAGRSRCRSRTRLGGRTSACASTASARSGW